MAKTHVLNVRKVQTKVNMEDFDDVLATGNIPDILKFMKEKNLVDQSSSFRISNIYWLCKDKTFFEEGLKILKSKGIYDRTFWSYGILH